MEQRKIMSLGRSSLVISLPKHWTQLNELKQGDAVSMAINRDRSLAVFPGARKERETSKITLHVGPEERNIFVVRSIIACYLNGYSNIKLVSKKFFTVPQQKAIRNIVRMLYMRIMEADTKEIQIATLIDESKASIQAGISRMYKISSSMCRDAFAALKNQDSALAKAVYTLDDEVDHFSFFLLRLVRRAVVDPALANQLDLEPIDCLDYQTLVHRIEQVADQAANTAKHIIMLEGRLKKVSKILLEKMYATGCDALASYDKAVSALLTSDVKRSDETIEDQIRIEKLDQEIASLAFSKEKSTEVICACCSIRDSIQRIAEYAADIAEITINRSYKPS
ncbi:MAG: phosphate uptake regulator PhoU [Candidatus Bathyarchaeota archaeon]|nr:phosphate uptake regulator PhoU [Candidatus Bathyarchaeota archaeon]MDH5786719.1 phosphate uptake regulator PhoU [Candidatus Bathyarchaeota archaeon]